MNMKPDDKFVPRADITIEGHQAKFNLAAHGAINGTYAGEFTFRCFLSPTQQIAANRMYREMLGTNPTLAGEHETFLAYALSQLKYRVLSAPPFWTATEQINGIAGDILDEEIITQVLDAAVHAQLKYKHELEKKKMELIERARQQAEKILNNQEDDEEFADEEDEK